MSFPLACADFTFPLLTHAQALQLVSLLDFSGIDIGLFEGRSHLWPSREFADTTAAARRLKDHLAEVALAPADLFLQMDPDFVPYAINQPEPARRQKARDWFNHTLDYAAELGCSHVTVLPGVHFEEEPLAVSLERAAAELDWRLALAQSYQVTVAVEAHVGSIVPDPASALELLSLVPGLSLTLDYTHFTRAGLADEAVEPLIPHATHFHVRGARQGRLQTSFQDNRIDYARVLRQMKAASYAGWLGIEYVWIDWEHCNECDNLSETILFRDFLRQLMA